MTISRQDTSQIIFLFRGQTGLKTGGLEENVKMERARFTTRHPEGSFNASKDIVERLLLDSMRDEVFILERNRSLDPETRAAVRQALDQMAHTVVTSAST